MSNGKKKELKRKVEASVAGNIRFAAVSVEAQTIPLKKSKSGFAGENPSVTLEPPDVTVFMWIKGGANAEYKTTVTINKKEWSTKGTVKTGAVKRTVRIPFSKFGLPVDEKKKPKKGGSS